MSRPPAAGPALALPPPCPRRWLTPTLFRRMFAAQALVVLGLLAVHMALELRSFNAPGGRIDQDLQLLAEATARMAALRLDAEGARRAAEDIEEMNRARSVPPIERGEFAWQVWTPQGRLIARSEDTPALPALPPGSVGGRERSERGDWLLLSAASPRGEVVAVVGYRRVMLERVLWRTLREAVPSALVSLVVVALALWLASRFGLRPLLALSAQIAARAPEDDGGLPPARHCELQPIVQAMNRLLEDVRAQRRSERAFFADAAHELRTPLAVINAQAHALAASDSAAQRRAALQALESGVGRSADVLEKLLTLARLDAAAALPRQLARVDVAALAREVVAQQSERALQSGHDLGAEAPAPAWARADAQALESALLNLVDNALRYTVPGSRIDVCARTEGDAVLLVVEDDGPGIPAQERERVWRRFERGSAAVGQAGSGLGLAIVAEALRRCGGGVALASSEGLGGACFTLRLPAWREEA
jgi:two-component system sensor histidine kinase QseC